MLTWLYSWALVLYLLGLSFILYTALVPGSAFHIYIALISFVMTGQEIPIDIRKLSPNLDNPATEEL